MNADPQHCQPCLKTDYQPMPAKKILQVRIKLFVLGYFKTVQGSGRTHTHLTLDYFHSDQHADKNIFQLKFHSSSKHFYIFTLLEYVRTKVSVLFQ